MPFPIRLPNETMLAYMPLTLANEAALTQVEVQESREPLVDLYDHCPTVHFRTRNHPFLSRRSVAEKLHHAQAWLDLVKPGFQLEVMEAYRSPRMTAALRRWYRSHQREVLPIFAKMAEAALQGGETRFAPLSSGGTVAVRILDGHGKPLPILNPTLSLNPANWWNAEGSRKHREILGQAMRQVGFVNALPTWWLWSYGDRLWSTQNGNVPAFFGEVARVRRVPAGSNPQS